MTPMERMSRARATLLIGHPFWGQLALYMKLVEKPDEPTMATDGEHLYFGPAFLETLSEKELQGVIAHEVSHCAYNHHTRRGSREPDLWNAAADYAINRDLLRAGFTLPKSALLDPRFDNMSAEEVYAVLLREREKQKQEGGGQGQPQDGQGDPGKCGRVMDAAKPHDKANLARIEGEWRVRVSQAIAGEKGAHAGQIPASLRRMFEKVKARPLDWRAILRRFIDEKSRMDFSWSRPNRRLLGQGFIVPGMIPDGVNHIGIVVDTSGSIDKQALSRFVTEIQAAVDDGATQKVTVVCCDTDVKAVHEFQDGERIVFKPVGGGGTRFSPALDWFAKNHPDVSALLYFTDLECSDYGEEPWVPVMWVAYGAAYSIAQRTKQVPFGEVLALVD